MPYKRTGRPPGRPPHPGPLTPAEERVLDGVRRGRSNPQFAAELGVTPDAVKYHVANMLSKLGVADRRELAAWQPVEPAVAGRRWWLGAEPGRERRRAPNGRAWWAVTYFEWVRPTR